MSEELQMTIDMSEESMQSAVDHLDKDLATIRAGKANPKMLDSIKVECYGVMSPLSQVANINTPDARTIVIQPWDKNLIGDIERTLINSNLGLNPDNNGEIIRLNIPPLTEERRKGLVKDVHAAGERAKVSLRSVRRDSNDDIKKMQKAGDISEDMEANSLAVVQDITNKFNKIVDEMISKKEEDVLTV